MKTELEIKQARELLKLVAHESSHLLTGGVAAATADLLSWVLEEENTFENFMKSSLASTQNN